MSAKMTEQSKAQQFAALFRDPELGVDVPIRTVYGGPAIWVARNRADAIVQVQATLQLEKFAQCEVVSLSEPSLRAEPCVHWWAQVPGGGYDRAANRTTESFECRRCGLRFDAVNGDRSFLK